MVLVEKEPYSWLQYFVIKLLKFGPIPRHIAFIMDGNRRYADKLNLNRMDGHRHGYRKFLQIVDWCIDFEIKEITIYAFSIENFKRSKEEVENLLRMIEYELREFMKGKIDEDGICVRVLGDITLLPSDLQKTVADIVLYSMHRNNLFINLCLAYTSREEISRAANEIAEAVSVGILKPEDIDEELLDQCMYNSSEPDLVIRTSGELRLSDFLLWQSSYSLLSFIKVLWPDCGIWNLIATIWSYQHSYKYIKAGREKHLEARRDQTERDINKYALSAFGEEGPTEEKLKDYASKRKERRNNFLCNLKYNRLRKLEEIKNNY